MFKSRRYFVLFAVLLSFLFLLLRLFHLQIVKSEWYLKLASRQHSTARKIEPRRGTIFDSHMDPLAINLDTPSIYCNFREIVNKKDTAKMLSGILNIDQDVLEEKIFRDKAFVWIKRKIDSDEAERVKKLGLKGIFVIPETKRYYPSGSMSAQLIGFAGTDNHGLEGLELLFDDMLKGKPGLRSVVRDARSRTVLLNEKASVPPQNGYNLILTIDSVIQYIAEEELEFMVKKRKPESASIVVMDPHSGKILALANYPNYDLNDFSTATRDLMKNSAITDMYEPGSVFKIMTASAVINEEIFDLEDRIYCEKGEYRTGGRILHDFHRYGDLSFREVIAKSSNIGTVKSAQKLGKEKLYEYIRKFGFGRQTGIDLPGEASGISRHPSVWSRSDITTIPIGQGIAVTPLQLASAVSVIANGGYLMKPYIVDEITTWDGETHLKTVPRTVHRAISAETCEKMKDIMHAVVTDGTGKRANSKIFEVCGKTGTAQMVNPGGGYYKDRYNATFVGFAPKDNPAVSIVVMAKNPRPVYFGGIVSGPVFKKVSERVLQYLGFNNGEERGQENG